MDEYSMEMGYLGFYYYGYLGSKPPGGRKGGPDNDVPYAPHPVITESHFTSSSSPFER